MLKYKALLSTIFNVSIPSWLLLIAPIIKVKASKLLLKVIVYCSVLNWPNSSTHPVPFASQVLPRCNPSIFVHQSKGKVFIYSAFKEHAGLKSLVKILEAFGGELNPPWDKIFLSAWI